MTTTREGVPVQRRQWSMGRGAVCCDLRDNSSARFGTQLEQSDVGLTTPSVTLSARGRSFFESTRRRPCAVDVVQHAAISVQSFKMAPIFEVQGPDIGLCPI
jgi:hypothetical protein